METMNPTQTEIKLLIQNALLENNVVINKSIGDSADKITLAMNQKTDTYINQLTIFAEKQGALKTQLDDVRVKVNNLWAKMIGVGAACATLGGLLVVLWSGR